MSAIVAAAKFAKRKSPKVKMMSILQSQIANTGTISARAVS